MFYIPTKLSNTLEQPVNGNHIQLDWGGGGFTGPMLKFSVFKKKNNPMYRGNITGEWNPFWY